VRQRTKQPSNWSFPLKVWAVTLVIAPFVFILVLAMVRSASWSDLYRSLPILLLLIIFGLMLLLPAVLLYWLAFWVLRRRPVQSRVKKLLLSIAGITAIWLLYYLFDRSLMSEGGFGGYAWPLSYSLVLATAGGLLKLPALPENAGKKRN
jgi:hypothetical protein